MKAFRQPTEAEQTEWEAFAHRWLEAEKQDTLWQPLENAELTTKKGSKLKVLGRQVGAGH